MSYPNIVSQFSLAPYNECTPQDKSNNFCQLEYLDESRMHTCLLVQDSLEYRTLLKVNLQNTTYSGRNLQDKSNNFSQELWWLLNYESRMHICRLAQDSLEYHTLVQVSVVAK
jgi:hypothetical protein